MYFCPSNTQIYIYRRKHSSSQGQNLNCMLNKMNWQILITLAFFAAWSSKKTMNMEPLLQQFFYFELDTHDHESLTLEQLKVSNRGSVKSTFSSSCDCRLERREPVSVNISLFTTQRVWETLTGSELRGDHLSDVMSPSSSASRTSSCRLWGTWLTGSCVRPRLEELWQIHKLTHLTWTLLSSYVSMSFEIYVVIPEKDL